MYFTDRLNDAFRMVFMSYDKAQAKEGLRLLESIVNNPAAYAEDGNTSTVWNDSSTSKAMSSTESDVSDVSPHHKQTAKEREIGDAYALLARIYAGPQFTPEELGFPEDNMRTYQCLHDSIRRESPIGTLQSLRIAGAITPTVERDMKLSFDEAFTIVLHHAELGDAYCQYVVGNVYFWGDYHRIPTAKARITSVQQSKGTRLSQAIKERSLRHVLHALRGTMSREEIKEQAVTEAAYWFNKALDNGLALFQGNLRNIYVDRKEFDLARATAKRSAELGNPTMMLYAGLDAHEHKHYEEALMWFTKGAELGQPECTSELADYYYHFYEDEEFRNTIPFEPIKAVELYTKAAARNFPDAGYAALQAAFGYIFHIGHLPLDWGRIADLTHTAANKDRYLFALPYIGYMRLNGLAVTRNIRYAVQSLERVLEEEERALTEENRILFYDITRALTRVALGYAYEKGYVTGKPNLDKAVHYYEESHQYILSYKEKLEPVLQDYPIDDEGFDRLQAFEQNNGHWIFKDGITESTSTARLPLPHCPQNCIRISFEIDGDQWETTEYDWPRIEQTIGSHGSLHLTWYNHFLSVEPLIRNVYGLSVKAMPRNQYQLTLSGYEYTEGQDMSYEAVLSPEKTMQILKDVYEHKRLPPLDEAWTVKQTETKPQWHYVLDVDLNHFLLEEYDDSRDMIQQALAGLKSKRYKQINIRTHDFVGPSYFIFPGNTKHPFRVQMFLKETPQHRIDDKGNPVEIPGNTYLLESYMDSEISLNYWIQRTINTLDTPDFTDWKQLPVPKDLSAF